MGGLLALTAMAVLVHLGCLVYCLTGGRAATHGAAMVLGTVAGAALGALLCYRLATHSWEVEYMTAGGLLWLGLVFVIGGGAVGGICTTAAVPIIAGLRGGAVSSTAEDAEIAAVEHIIEEHKQP